MSNDIVLKRTRLFALFLILIVSCKPSFHKDLVDSNEVEKQNLKYQLNQVKVTNIRGDSCLMLESMSNIKYNLILRVPRYSCSSCVTREICNLSDCLIAYLSIGERVTVIYGCPQHRLFSARIDGYNNLPFNFYNYPKTLLDQDSLKKPYYMIVASTGEIRYILMVNKQDNESSLKFIKYYIDLN